MELSIGNKIRVREPSDTLMNYCYKNLRFRNPEFVKKKRMGFYTGNTPEYLYLYEKNGDTLILPYGCLKVLEDMWDYLLIGKDGKPTTVLEMKTSQRSEDWKDDIPEYYALQAALYAYLLGVDSVIMVASFLEPGDYDNPEKFVCTGKNTITRPFLVSERYPDFEKKYVKPALKWWKDHVETGISPVYDEKKDADILKALRTNNLSPESDITAIVKEAEELKEKLDKAAANIAADEKRYKTLTDMLKKYAQGQFRDGDKQVDLGGSKYSFVMSRTDSMKVDEAALKKAGLFDQYAVPKTTYTLRVKMKKEETK